MVRMKKVMLIALSVMMMVNVQAQTFSEWFRQKKTQIEYYTKQIAALKMYNDLLLEGYGIARDGLQVVSDLKQGDFDLHNNYFTSLKAINGSVTTDRARNQYDAILQHCKAVNALIETLPGPQQGYANNVIMALQTKAGEHYREYQLLTNSENYQLTDDARLRRIDAMLCELDNQYAFAKQFNYGLEKMILQQEREAKDATGIQNIYQP
jgi:hypothetical protein